MPYFIAEQLVKQGRGDDAEMVPMPVKTIGNACIEYADGTKEFVMIPPIIRLYIGRTEWGSPAIVPTAEELENGADVPDVWTVTLNPRTENFNWHFGFGQGARWDVDPYSGEERLQSIKPESGKASVIRRKLAERVGSKLADKIVATMAVELQALRARQEAAKKKREEKAAKQAAKPSKAAPMDDRAAQKAAILARKQAEYDRQYQERVEAEKRRAG